MAEISDTQTLVLKGNEERGGSMVKSNTPVKFALRTDI